MKPDDLRFVRLIRIEVAACKDPFHTSCRDKEHLFALLIESEARANRIQWKKDHGDWCLRCMDDCHHDWSDADWIEAVRKEIEGE